jgi:hypothetical protein
VTARRKPRDLSTTPPVLRRHRTQDAKTFDKVRADEKFSYIVALARTINAVNYAHSMLEFERKIETPAAIRNRINSYLFASSIRYEALMLIRKLTRTFKNENKFNNGLRQLLRDKTAIGFERQNRENLRAGEQNWRSGYCRRTFYRQYYAGTRNTVVCILTSHGADDLAKYKRLFPAIRHAVI